jgi:protein TonB
LPPPPANRASASGGSFSQADGSSGTGSGSGTAGEGRGNPGSTTGASDADGASAAATSSGPTPTEPGADAAQANRSPQLTPPRLLAAAGIDYPADAFRLTVRRQDLGTGFAVEGAEGIVALRVLVRSDGAVSRVEVAGSSGSDVLDRAAVDAVRRWQFAPAMRDGVPIDAYATLKIRYVVR